MTRDYEIINDIFYCCNECRYLKWDYDGCCLDGWCSLLKKDLHYYDWFIAECAQEQEKINIDFITL